MVCTNHGGLPTAAILGPCPPPYAFVTGDLNFPSKIWSKSVVHSADPSEDTLKRFVTTVPPSITTTHHHSGLPSPLSYTLADDDPPLPSIYSTVEAKFKGQAPIPRRVDKMGGSEACRQIRSKTKDGEGRLGVPEGSRQATGSSGSANQWAFFV